MLPTMDNRPLSYDSLKVVLKNMNANKRFEAAAHCPSIRKTEKLIPLKINHLNFVSDYVVQVNDKCYKLGIIRKNRDGVTLPRFQRRNNQGGISVDLDEWGFERRKYGSIKTPGDIQTDYGRSERERDWDFDYDSGPREIERRLIKLRREYRGTDSLEDVQIQRSIDYYEDKLAAYFYRNNNVTLPYNSYIQLSSVHMERDEQKCRPLEVVLYKKRLYEAMKYLSNFMFGGRNQPIYVKHFKVSGCPTLRLPEGVKFNIQGVNFSIIEKHMNQLLPILDTSCLPLRHFHLMDMMKFNYILRSPLCEHVEEVTVDSYCRPEAAFSTDEIFDSPFLKTNFLYPWFITDGSNSYVGLSTFVKKIMKRDKAVGTKYSFRFEDEYTINDILVTIEKKLRRHCTRDKNNGFLNIRMSDSKCISISYKLDNQTVNFESQPPPWVFQIEVMEKKN